MDREVTLMISTNSFRAPWPRRQCSHPFTPAVAHPTPLPAARGHLRVVIKLPGWFMVEGDAVDDTTPTPSNPPIVSGSVLSSMHLAGSCRIEYYFNTTPQ